MKRRLQTKVTIETLRSLRVGATGSERLQRCPQCKSEVPMVTAEEAAALVEITVRKLYRWVEKGSLHFIETPSGQVWICLTSLMHKKEPATKARSRGA